MSDNKKVEELRIGAYLAVDKLCDECRGYAERYLCPCSTCIFSQVLHTYRSEKNQTRVAIRNINDSITLNKYLGHMNEVEEAKKKLKTLEARMRQLRGK